MYGALPDTSTSWKSLHNRDVVNGTLDGPITYSGMSDGRTGEWMEACRELVDTPESRVPSKTDVYPSSLVEFGLKI